MSRKPTHLPDPKRALSSGRDYDKVSSGADQTRVWSGLYTFGNEFVRESWQRRKKEATSD